MFPESYVLLSASQGSTDSGPTGPACMQSLNTKERPGAEGEQRRA